MFLSFDPKEIKMPQIQALLTAGVAPRPIAFVSTVSNEGHRNLSPFSFFNAFGSNPPMIAFSPSNRGKDNSLKDTYNNIMATKECVINAVTLSMVEQVNLASSEYGSSVDEFIKSGFTAIDSDLVKPARVKESPFQMECKLFQMVNLGDGPASGNLAICEVVKFHVAEYIMANGKIDPLKINHAGRNGGEFYTKASGNALFEIEKPGLKKGIGFDNLPFYILESNIYSANNLARFAMTESIPSAIEVNEYFNKIEPKETDDQAFEHYLNYYESGNIISALAYFGKFKINKPAYFEKASKIFIENKNYDLAWKIAVYKGILFHGE